MKRIDQRLARFCLALALVLGAALAVPAPALASQQVYYLHGDHLGTPRVATNAANQVVWRHLPTGEPFGAAAPEEDPDGNGQATVIHLRFPGQYFDRETGLSYNYFRDYDPRTGRYVQSDPVGLDGGINTYSYVGGNPVSYVDPTGEQATLSWCLGGPAGCTVGVGALILMSPPGQQALKAAGKAVADLCKSDDDNDPCDVILDKGQLKAAGIRGREHEVKSDELGTNRNLSKFDLCGCKDGRVVVKAHGCKGPVISVTDYRWK